MKNKNITTTHPRMSLSGICSCRFYERQTPERCAPPDSRGREGGFTLLELLVVVLIIGILAAVAVPQYQVAVNKTRVMGIITFMRAVDNAQQVYKIANGTYAENFDELDIDIPAGAEFDGTYAKFNGWRCQIWSQVSIFCDRHSQAPDIEKYFSQAHWYCWGKKELAKKTCQSLHPTEQQDGDTIRYKFSLGQ